MNVKKTRWMLIGSQQKLSQIQNAFKRIIINQNCVLVLLLSDVIMPSLRTVSRLSAESKIRRVRNRKLSEESGRYLHLYALYNQTVVHCYQRTEYEKF